MQKTTIYSNNNSRLFLLAIVVLFSSTLFAQNNLEINLIQRSVEPISKTQHFHMLEIHNTSGSLQTIHLKAENTSCSPTKTNLTELKYLILDENKNNINEVALSPNQKMRFILKTNRSFQTQLDMWNCIKVSAVQTNSRSLLGSLVVESYIPNPTSFN